MIKSKKTNEEYSNELNALGEKVTKYMNPETDKQVLQNIESKVNSFAQEQEWLKQKVEENKETNERFFKELTTVNKKVSGSSTQSLTENYSTEPKISCTMCDLKFKERHQMKKHIKMNHPKLMVCSICDDKFTECHKLEEHLMDVHKKKKNFTCSVCKVGFVLRWRMAKHVKLHEQTSIKTCHYFNNQKECPFARVGCKFIHEEADLCRFQRQCDRPMCQFKHS